MKKPETTFNAPSQAETDAALERAKSPAGQLVILNTLMGTASIMLKRGMSKTEVISALSGNLEEYDFIAVSGAFYKELGQAMDIGYKAVEALTDCLFINKAGEVAFKPEGPKSIIITTHGGMTLTALIDNVTHNAVHRMAAEWDMRHGLIHNPKYYRMIADTDIKDIKYVR